ncbi:MAG: hypothetical protein QF570_17475 [Myxococcota bacterium]|jgi:hypothetical protein|nr:hypothetical protein [Myxococcota bacterium]
MLLLMARGTVDAWQQQLLCRGYPPELPVALISRGCTPDEKLVETTVAHAARDLEQSSLETPLMAVVGWVVTLRSRLRPSLEPMSPWSAAVQPVALAHPQEPSLSMQYQDALGPVAASGVLDEAKRSFINTQGRGKP